MIPWLKRHVPTCLPLWLAVQRLVRHGGIELSGFIAYTALLSLFPFIIVLCSLAGFFGDASTAQQVIDAAFDFLPTEVASTLTPIVREIFGRPQAGLLTVGVAGTLWVASSSIEALRLGTTRGWELPETRPAWQRRITSFGFIAFAALCALATSVIVIASPFIMAKLEHYFFLEETLFTLATLLLRLALGFALIVGAVGLLYRYLPPKSIPWKFVWPGAWLVASGWILLGALFSLYLKHFGNYSVTYGSLGGVVITLLFLQFSALLFLFGVEFNAVLGATPQKLASPRRTAKKSSSHKESPWQKSKSKRR